jgi:diacylglycerol kinase (ATP)
MTQSQQCIVIINPTAGRGEANKQVPNIRNFLGKKAVDWNWHYTKSRGHAEQMARAAVESGVGQIVVVGGDGTLHEVANGVLGSNIILGLIPFGTGNDFARSLGFYGNLEAACKAVTDGDIIHVDMGTVEGTGIDGPRHFIVLAGTGFDAQTARTVNNGIKWISGAPAYIFGAIATLIRFKPFELKLTLDDGVTRRTKAMFVSIANAPSTGGGMLIAPEAKLNDGLFEICLVAAVPKIQLLYQLTKVFEGKHVLHPAVSMLKSSTVSIEADPPQPILIDGEVMGTTPFKITIIPKALRIRIPAQDEV